METRPEGASEHPSACGGQQLWLFSEVPEGSAAARSKRGSSALEHTIAKLYPRQQVAVVFTCNRTVILSLKSRARTRILRSHECFREAPGHVLEAVARLYLGRPTRTERRQLTTLVTSWHQKAARPPASPQRAELICGTIHHLPTILDIVNRSYFEGALSLDISYGTRTSRRMMARHEARTPRSLILVNPLLDHAQVKAWYLHYLVFHECLHEVIPPRAEGGRLLLHPPEFRRRENLHPDAALARTLETWLTGAGHARLLADYRQSMNQTRHRSTPAPLAARRTRRKRHGQGFLGAGDP